MGWASNLDTTTTTYDPWQSSATTTATIYVFPQNTATNYEVVEEIKKPPYRPPPGVFKERGAPKELKARHGFQQMCRIPCYRGTRTR